MLRLKSQANPFALFFVFATIEKEPSVVFTDVDIKTYDLSGSVAPA
jgi:hypothetical protein